MCDLIELVLLSQPTVSHHLRVIVDVGLLNRNERGIWTFYALAPGALHSVAALLSSTSPAASAAKQPR